MPAPRDPRLAYFTEHHRESVERMFAAVGDLYAQHWNEFFHFAIFDADTQSLDAAFHATHERYFAALRVADARHVLELGCGRGRFSHELARRTAGDVLGIDISRAQLARARRFRRRNLRFRRHDIMHVDEIGRLFDAVVCLDAACYLPDKARAIERIAKVTAPGGRFLCVEWCKQAGLSRVQEELVLLPFMHYWGVPNLETAPNYRKLLTRNGFALLDVADVTEKARRNWDLGYEHALRAIKEWSVTGAARLLWKRVASDAGAVRLVKEQFPAAVYIKVGFDAGFLRYVCFLAEKKT